MNGLYIAILIVLGVAVNLSHGLNPRNPAIAYFPGACAGYVEFLPLGRQFNISGVIRNLPPHQRLRLYVHENGDVGQNCAKIGAFYSPWGNPRNRPLKSGPADYESNLGTYQSNAAGELKISKCIWTDNLDTIRGYIGLALAVHKTPRSGFRHDARSHRNHPFLCSVIGYKEKSPYLYGCH